MSKQRKRRRKRKPPAPSRFKVGDRIWVRHGIRDVDHSDVPLGGWAGTFYMDRAAATNGIWSGALIGLAGGLFLCLVALPLAFLAFRKP